MKIHPGVSHFPRNISRIKSLCDAAEVSSFIETKPKETTLSKWRTEVKKDFRFIIPAPMALTDPGWKKDKPGYWKEGAQGFTSGETADKIWNAMDRSAGLLRSNTFLFSTPINFRPSFTNRKKLVDFFSSRRMKNYRIVWEPGGLWEPEDALDFAKSSNLILASDPLNNDFINPEGDFRYFRVHSLKSTSGISQMGFDTIYDACLGAKRVFVIFSTPKALKDVKQFKTYISEIE